MVQGSKVLMMRFSFLPKLDVKKDPNALLRLFMTTAVVSVIVITSFAGFGFHEVLQRYVIDNAEEDAINVSSALLSEVRDKIVVLHDDGNSGLAIRKDDLPALDRHIRRFLTPFSIVKIKIYSSDRRIVYSTEAKLIGEVDRQNKRLNSALTGEFDSKFERKEEVKDLTDELKFNVDVVETYIPIRDTGKKVIGSFEVYLDVTKYREQSGRALALSLGILLFILVLVFGLSFLLIRKATRDIKQIQEMLKKQTITDPLTGIFNKRQILLMAHKEFSRASRRRKRAVVDGDLGLIMIDIDHFKEVNDTYGHLAGDVLLKELAERISYSLRTYDAVGRFGGDEFLVVLPSANLHETGRVAQKVWTLIREEPFLLEGQRVTVTASVGLAASQEDDTEYVQVLKRADEGVYRAKDAGRDRVA
jgi:diguanylate cyclase (GGDEF)-like protein